MTPSNPGSGERVSRKGEKSKFLAVTHDRLIEARHKLYAHRDQLAAEDFDYDDDISAKAYEVKIRIYDDSSGFAALLGIPDLNPEILPNVSRLANYQSDRAETISRKLFTEITNGKKFTPGGDYTVGVDFP